MCIVTASEKVTTGSAARGAEGTRRFSDAMNCSDDIRLRTLSCATMMAPAFPKFSFPPVWSPWKCVFRTNFTGDGVMVRIAATIFGV